MNEHNEQEQRRREDMTEHGAVTRMRQTFPHPWKLHASYMPSIGTATVSAARPGVQVSVAASTLLQAVERLEAVWLPVEEDVAGAAGRRRAAAQAKLDAVRAVCVADPARFELVAAVLDCPHNAPQHASAGGCPACTARPGAAQKGA